MPATAAGRINPIEARESARRLAEASAITFRRAFETYFATKRKSLSNAKHAAQCRHREPAYRRASADRDRHPSPRPSNIRTAGHACAPIGSVSSPAPSPTFGTRDASLTEAQTMALSGHKTPEAVRPYVKRTNVQRDGVTSPAPVGGDGTERGQTSE